MKKFEFLFLCIEPWYPYLYRTVRQRLKKITSTFDTPCSILDVGGRKSHYTIGLKADLTISDLPRESDIQSKLNLGLTNEIIQSIHQRRSNLKEVVFDDMTCTQLPENSYDCIVAVEVLEHVEEDTKFVENVFKVLKKDGVFLMTTPNGDLRKIPSKHGDHVRHYSKKLLYDTLSRCFCTVDIDYAVKGGLFRTWGLKSWKVKHPIQTIKSMVGNFINSFQSSRRGLKDSPMETLHLIAIAKK